MCCLIVFEMKSILGLIFVLACLGYVQAICGDGTISGSEQCDGIDVGSATCASVGYPFGGILGCSNCQYDTSRCAVCGDGRVMGTELCDGTNTNGHSCATEGFTDGTLTCAPSCSAFDTSACTKCGNGVREVNEQCDGTDFGGMNCYILRNITGGTMTCTSQCTYDFRHCATPTVNYPTAGSSILQVIGIRVNATGFLEDHRVSVTFDDGRFHTKRFDNVVISYPAGSLQATFQLTAPMAPSTSWTVKVVGTTTFLSATSAAFTVK